jgi:hypothetical protein
MGVKTDFSIYLVGGMDAQENCEVGAYKVNGVMLTSQKSRHCTRWTSSRSGPKPMT